MPLETGETTDELKLEEEIPKECTPVTPWDSWAETPDVPASTTCELKLEERIPKERTPVTQWDSWADTPHGSSRTTVKVKSEGEIPKESTPITQWDSWAREPYLPPELSRLRGELNTAKAFPEGEILSPWESWVPPSGISLAGGDNIARASEEIW